MVSIMFARVRKCIKKMVTSVIVVSTILGSLGSPLGLFLYPQIAHASAPAPTFGGPNDGQTGVPKDAPIDRGFDQALDGTTVTTTNVLLQANTGNTQTGAPTGANLCTSVTLGADFNANANRKITCVHPDGADSTWYTFTITTGVKNTSAEALPSNFVVRFQTGTFTAGSFSGGATFAPPPQITGTVPGPGGTIPANGKLIVNFNPGGLNPTTSTMATSGDGSVLSTTNVQLFSQVNSAPSGSNLISASHLSWNAQSKQLIVAPTALLTANSFYLLVVQHTVKNTDSNLLGGGDFHVPFQAIANDTVAPTFVAMFPADASTSIDRATYDIGLSFNEALDVSSVSSSTVQLILDANNDGTLNETAATNAQLALDPDGRTIHISPLTLLTASRKHFVKVVSGAVGVKDLVGNVIGADIVKSFTTGTNINGAASDTTKPIIGAANANNFELSVTFSEPMHATSTATLSKYTLESPGGTVISLSGKFIEYKAFTKTVFIRGLAVAPGQTFKVTVASSTLDLVGNKMDETGTPAKNTFQGTVGNATQAVPGGGGTSGGAGGGHIDFFAFGTEPIMVMPDSQIAGGTSQYRVEFKATTSIPSGGKIVLTFPTGFTFAAACDTKLDQFDNNDINGPSPNTVTFTPACDSQARTATLTTASGATNPNDFLHFKLQGIVNSPVPKDFSTGGYTIDIKTFDASNNLLDSKTSMPFFLSTPGTQSISGFVFNDTDKDNTKDAGESGVNAVSICLGGPMVGFNCTTTDSSGAYSFGSLNNGFYHVEVPPITSSLISAVGGFMFRDINLTGGASQANVDFGLKPSDGTINVTVSGGPASEKVDVFGFNPFNTSTGGHVVRELTLSGSGGGTVALPVALGKWQVSVGPWMPKTAGAPPPPPEFKFLPPQPQEVSITSGATTASVSFALQATNRTIKGKVVDGSGSGISNAFVNARPATASAGVFGGGFSQAKSDGTFSLSVVNGTYVVEVHMPGMPPAEPVEVTVKNDSSNVATDNNSTADVYSSGALVKGVGITLKIAKADRSIAGRVLDESGNAIAYAFVNGEKVDPNNPGVFLGHFVGAPTDSSGNFTLYTSDGTYKLRAFAPGFGDLGTKTVVVSGASLTDINFQASTADFGTVSGTVTVAGTAQAGAFVNIFGPSGGNGTVTGSDGTYSVKVKTGTEYVAEGFIPGKGPLAPTAAFAVTTSGVTGKDLSLAGTGTITVTISGVNDAFVDARDANGRGFGTGSATNGVYTLTLPTSASGTAYTVKAGTPKYGLIGSQSVTLATDAAQSVSFSVGALLTVSGTISSSAAACASGVSIFLTDPTNGRHIGGSSDANGAYSIQVPSGSYSLVSGKPGCVDNSNPAKVVVSGANVSTGTNRTMTAADSAITGRVTLSGSNATTPTVVFADNGSGKFVVADVDTSATGTSNNYTLNVTAGTWTVKARSDGSQSSSFSVTVTSGATVTRDLTLSAISGYTIREARPFNVKPSQGGLVKNTDIGSSFEVNIPAGALGSSANDATITTKEKTSVIDPPSDSIDVLGDKAIEVTPTDASGNKITTLSGSSGASATITIPYAESDIPSGTSESNLTCGVWSSEKQTWEALSTTVDTTNNTLTCTTSHFSDFAPLASVGGSSAPSTPGGVNAGSPGRNSALVTWSTVSGATGYSVYRDTASDGSFPRVGSDPTVTGQSSNSYVDASLSCGTTYYYKVTSKNADGESAASSASSVTTLACDGSSGGGTSLPGGGGSPGTAPKTPTPITQTPVTPSVPSTLPSKIGGLLEGALVRIANGAKVFVVQAGKLLHVPNLKAFKALGLNMKNVQSVEQGSVQGVTEITLQKAANSPKVYTVRDGRKLHIPSAQAFAKAGHQWSDIVQVQAAILGNTPDATLIRPSDSPKVFKIEKDKLRWVKTENAFKRLKLKWEDVAVVGSNELYYPAGTDIK